ncbi:MAG: adenylate/guanylate cyclase domain-containing protein [Elusimicrobia bacterium]|nr:adenylate/guanylate cyclase domain-containing protein [Elusimicrobiota bacterium]
MPNLTKRLRGLIPLIALLAAVGGLALASRSTEVMQGVELKTLDWRARRFADPSRSDPAIVHVTIDQASLDYFEKDHNAWPWPRDIYVPALSFLKDAGARAVVFDVLFTNAGEVSLDAALGAAVKDAGVVVLAMETDAKADPRRPEAAPARFAAAAGPALAAGAAKRASVRLPIAPLLSGARALGDTKAEADLDGVFRGVPVLVSLGGRLYPTLPAAAAMLATGKTLDELAPRLTDGRLLVRFHGKGLTAKTSPLKTYESYHFSDLVTSFVSLAEKTKPPLDPALFKDKVVFIGMSAPGLLDNHPSPIDPVFPGTEIVAAAADNLMHGDGLTRAPRAFVLGLVALALVLAGASSRLSSHLGWALGVMLASSGLLLGASCAAFSRRVWLDLASPQLALWLGFAAASAWSYAVEGRQKRYIQGAFSFYLSPEVVRQIAERPEALALGGERREATFYFSDIEGFTSFSEKLGPEKLTQLMNRYLGEMTETVLDSGGTLDKYIGDAIMSFWGAPLPCEGHALVACKVALANQKKLAGLKAEFDGLGYPPVRNRIGLNTGPAIIGNMGSPKRFSYTAIGDAVNLASRLEGANKAYGTYILISESTRRGAGAAVEVRELDFVKVKGKSEAIRVYELLGLKGETEPALIEKARLFESGLAAFRSRRFPAAVEIFTSVVDKYGHDHACENYLERCERYLKEPPPADWDGSNALTEK